MNWRRAFGLVLAAVSSCWSATKVEPVDPSKGLVLANRWVRLEFAGGGMGLAGITDLRSGVKHLQQAAAPYLLWEVAFGKGAQIERITNNYKPCNYAHVETLANGTRRAVMEWNGLRWWLENQVLTVRAVVELPADSGVAEWRISVDNSSDYWGLWSVTYPLVNGFPEAGKYDLARPIFGSGGHLLRKWSGKIEARYPSGGWPMQFLALTEGRSGVYFASMDGEARAKDFVVESGRRLAMVHYPENMGVAGSDYPDSYAVAFGVYEGGWLEAAQRYRPWALRQKWSQAGKLSARTDVPDVVKDVGLWARDGWVWNGAAGTPHEQNVPFLEAQKKMGVPMALHWYDWHHMKFDNEYPHFLPAKPGFRERVAELKSQGLLVMPYINGSSADFNIADFARFGPHAITDEGGGYRQHRYSDAAGRLLSMCPSQEFWQSTIANLVDRLIGEEGVNGVYVDQVSAMSHELCFHPQHGHPIGGGRYWADGNRELMRKVRQVSQRKNRQAVITSEGADEVFFDLLDANLTWAEASDLEIPLMEVVYSGYTLFFGSPCDYAGRSNRFFRWAQGEAMMDGRQNGWMTFGLFEPAYAAKADYFRQCGRYRVAAKKFLTYGQLLGPLEPSQPVPTFTEEGFGWQQKHSGTVAGAEGRLWKAEDGHLGVFLANYLDERVAFPYRIDPADFGLKGGEYVLTELSPDGSKALARVKGPVQRTEALGPGQIQVIEIASARP